MFSHQAEEKGQVAIFNGRWWMACNRKNGGKIQCHTVPQGMPILPTPRAQIIEIFDRTFAHNAHVHQAHMRTLQIY
jgi:hypothetical protein